MHILNAVPLLSENNKMNLRLLYRKVFFFGIRYFPIFIAELI